MAVVTRYFSNSGVGAADGTTWNDRAALFTSSGTWSSIIRNFPFASGGGPDSLYCMVEGGKYYYCNEKLQGSILASGAPTASSILYIHGCDSSGNFLDPPDPDWVSSQPPFETGTLPYIFSSGTGDLISLVNSHLRCLATTTYCLGTFIGSAHIDWMYINTLRKCSSIFAGSAGTNRITNTAIVASSGFDSAISQSAFMCDNVRIDATAAMNGNQIGLNFTSTGGLVSRATVIGCTGSGMLTAGGSSTRVSNIQNCLFINNGYGVTTNSTASQTVFHNFDRNLFINNNVAINASGARLIMSNNRFRDNVSGDIINLGNFSSGNNIFTTGTNTDEFVGASSGDYRIKYGSSLWGKGIGPGDEPAPTTNIISRNHPLG